MLDTDRLFYGFMLTMTLCILALLISLIGCTGPLQIGPRAPKFCDPLNLSIADKAQDPCELEYWEDQQFAKEGLGG